MEKEEKKPGHENEEMISRMTTPSISRQLQTFHENMEQIQEQNEEDDQKSLKNTKITPFYEDYGTRKSSQLFTKNQKFLKKDSESIVTEIEKQSCCLKKQKKKKNVTKENTVCTMPCIIF